jgi:hypothetical protein
VVKVRLGSAADHSPPSNAAVMEEYSYTSTHPLGHTGPVTGLLYLQFSGYVLWHWEFRSGVINNETTPKCSKCSLSYEVVFIHLHTHTHACILVFYKK